MNTLLAGQRDEVSAQVKLTSRVDQLERASDAFQQIGSPALRPRIEALERWRDHVESVGSPQVQELQKKLLDLTTAFETHRLTEKK